MLFKPAVRSTDEVPMSMNLRASAAWAVVSIVFLLGAVGRPALAQDEALSQSYIDDLKRYTVGDDRKREDPPAIDKPLFIGMSDAALYMEPQDVVFVEEAGTEDGRTYIYPRSVLVQHEVVNLREDGPRRTVTYCPLTGSVVGVFATVNDQHSTAFGTMGMLVNSNRVLYDRATNSLCPQILGTCIKGPLKNERLDHFPLLWTTWNKAADRYPHALVLSRETGWRRPYGRDPYGSYARGGTYYQVGGSYYPLSHVDSSVHPKARVLGLARGEVAVAILEDSVRERRVVSVEFGLERLVALFDAQLNAVRIFYAQADDRELRFEMAGGEIVDLETRSRWDIMGRAVSGRLRGVSLKRAPAVNCMWFAWKAFHPYTRIGGRSNDDDVLGL